MGWSLNRSGRVWALGKVEKWAFSRAEWVEHLTELSELSIEQSWVSLWALSRAERVSELGTTEGAENWAELKIAKLSWTLRTAEWLEHLVEPIEFLRWAELSYRPEFELGKSWVSWAFTWGKLEHWTELKNWAFSKAEWDEHWGSETADQSYSTYSSEKRRVI
jgi:hypothetical protein